MKKHNGGTEESTNPETATNVWEGYKICKRTYRRGSSPEYDKFEVLFDGAAISMMVPSAIGIKEPGNFMDMSMVSNPYSTLEQAQFAIDTHSSIYAPPVVVREVCLDHDGVELDMPPTPPQFIIKPLVKGHKVKRHGFERLILWILVFAISWVGVITLLSYLTKTP